MGTRQILTLQFGHYSNFIGTHWWNLQELGFEYNPNSDSEINNDVLYREGQTQKGETTFTPRLLLVDLKNSLKSLPESGELYSSNQDPDSSQIPWHKELVEVKSDTKIAKNKYLQDLDNITNYETDNIASTPKYNLETTVNVWSDFLYTRFHTRTVNIIKQYEHCNEKFGFDVFPLGKNLWKSEQFEEDFSDKIRNYVEECDYFQGFQILTDAANAFGGLSLACMEHIADDYERKSVLAIPVIPPHTNEFELSQINDSIHVLNLALCFEGLAEIGDLFVPVCTNKIGWRRTCEPRKFYHLNYDEKLAYHTSAIVASALDTLTLKYRLKSSSYLLANLCADLNQQGRKAAAASLCLPFSFNKDAYLIDCLDNWDGPLLQSITPNCEIGTDRQMQIITLRGIPEERLKSNMSPHKQMPAYKCNSVNEMLQFYLSCTCFGTASNVTTVSKALNVGIPFPNFFDPFVGVDGNIQAELRHEHARPNSVPVLAGLHSGKEIGDLLETLHTEARRIRLPKVHQFLTAGLETDNITECLDRLFDLRECYEDNYLI